MTKTHKGPPAKLPTAAPQKPRLRITSTDKDNLPPVSRQTAGGIAGAAIGGIVAGPVGAVVGGVAGAMVGNSSAAGERPIERTVENIRAVAEKPARDAYARISTALAHRKANRQKKAVAKKAVAKKAEVRAKATAARKTAKAA